MCRYQFRGRDLEVAVLKEMTKDEVLECYKRFLQPGSKQRSRLAVHVIGKKHSEELASAVPGGMQLFSDPEELRASLKLLPAPPAASG